MRSDVHVNAKRPMHQSNFAYKILITDKFQAIFISLKKNHLSDFSFLKTEYIFSEYSVCTFLPDISP